MSAPPDWIWLVVVGLAGWGSRDFWPALRGWLDADFKAKREAEAKRIDDNEKRFLAAFEQSAKASEQAAQNGRDVAIALRVIGETRVADNLTLQRIERHMDEIESALGRLGVMRRRAAERKEGS